MVSFLQHNNITLFTPNNKYKCHHTFLCSQQSVSVGSVPGKVLNNYSIVVSEEQGVLWGKLITGRVLCVVWRIKRLTDGWSSAGPGYFVNLAPRVTELLILHPTIHHQTSPDRDIGGRGCHVLSIGPRGIFAAIYENKNMERIIYQRTQKKAAMITMNRRHLSSAGLNINKYSSEQRTYGPGSWKYPPVVKIDHFARLIVWPVLSNGSQWLWLWESCQWIMRSARRG